MTSDSVAFLTSLRLADSFLPVGGYTASYGIEQYLNEDRITDIETLRTVLAAYLVRTIGPCETVALANAYDACESSTLNRLLAVDDWLHAMTIPQEFRRSSATAGGQLCRLLLVDDERTSEDSPQSGAIDVTAETDIADEYAGAVEDGSTPGHFPVVFGVVAHREGLAKREAALAHAYSFVTGILGGAQRLGRFGHTEIQRLLTALQPVIATVCERHLQDDVSSMATFAPLAEIMGMSHERAGRRLFTS